jgi:ethanolamine-phosphate cytidylyltransferase
MVRAVKWVDDIIPDAPYAITEEFMNKLFTEYNIDYIIHGDDPCLLPDGTDAYALAKKAGRYKQIKRTEGVSTTDIVGNSSALVFLFSFLFVKLCFTNNDIEV